MTREKPIDFTPTEELLAQIGSVSAGTRMELLTEYIVKDNGKWCIVNIEKVPMPGYDAEGNPTGGKHEYMEGGDFTKRYQEAMGS